jgi:hypothetical protein
VKAPAGFFISHDGALCRDTPAATTVREHYARTHRTINTGAELRATLRAGSYAWPGGYPLFLLTDDGASLCFACVLAELPNVLRAIRAKVNDGWRVVGCDVNYEDEDNICSHCNARIPSAYGNDEGQA